MTQLPRVIDFDSSEAISEATTALVESARQGKLTNSPLFDGVVAAGVPLAEAVDISVEISTTPTLRDRLKQAPFATGHVIGSAFLAQEIGITNA